MLHIPSARVSAIAEWLVVPRPGVSPAIREHLIKGLFGSIPIFLGGVFNTIAVAAAAAIRHPTELFALWLALEILLGISRLATIIAGRRALHLGQRPPTQVAALLSCAWAASVGFGAYISIASEDWVVATLTCLSAAAMMSGICLRNYGTPRLVTVMMVLSLGPCALAALLSREPILFMISIQLPIYMLAIGSAAFKLNGILVGRMQAQDALEKSEAFNGSILEASPDYTLLLDEAGSVIFCNGPKFGPDGSNAILGRHWLEVLPTESQAAAKEALASAATNQTAQLTVTHAAPAGQCWFDVAVSRISDGSERTLIVARDITHQKEAEEQALWMANHDPLTRLPNRTVLQDRLDALTRSGRDGDKCALLVLDLDNFKVINDTLGHDAGDALLCCFADRLRAAVRAEDLIARLGGDEFAILLHARCEKEVRAATDKIFAELRQPFFHNDRVVDWNVSIGASLYPRDGIERSELMKKADIALYAAKANGKGQLRSFQPSLRRGLESRKSMISMARQAVDSHSLVPHYQPKISLRTGDIIGFESLLRWKDPAGALQLPDKLKAAFEDPMLSGAISDRMIDQILDDVRLWLDDGVNFGHVSINAAAVEFRQNRFADDLLERLRRRAIPAHVMQLEVTETVFLGRGAEHAKRALQVLNEEGVRIALDDFGTGFASLSHLMHFPVHVLKIDKSFIRGIGRSDEARAITKAVVNLGQSLGIEVVAEGVERAEQEIYLKRLGCHVAQGFLYSPAVPGQQVPHVLARVEAESA